MTSILKIRGRAVLVGKGTDRQALRGAPEVARDQDGNLLTEMGQRVDGDGVPIYPAPRPQEMISGRPYYEPEHDLLYRVVDAVDPEQGWMPMDYWMRRYGVQFGRLRDWCLRGLLDPVYEMGSPTPRYRARDERKLVADLKRSPPSEHEMVLARRRRR